MNRPVRGPEQVGAHTAPRLSCSFDETAGLLTLYYTGNVTFEEWVRVLEAALEDRRYRPTLGIVADRSAVPEPPSTAFMEAAVAYLLARQVLAETRLAVVVRTAVGYGMARTAAELAGEHHQRIAAFTEVDQARAWAARCLP